MKKFLISLLYFLLIGALLLGLVGCDEVPDPPSAAPPASSDPAPTYVYCSSYDSYLRFLAGDWMLKNFLYYDKISIIGDFYSFYGKSYPYTTYFYVLKDCTGKHITFGVEENKENWEQKRIEHSTSNANDTTELQATSATDNTCTESNGIYFIYQKGSLTGVYWKCRTYYMYLILPPDYPTDVTDTFAAGILHSHEKARETLYLVNDNLPSIYVKGKPHVMKSADYIECADENAYRVFVEANPSLPFYFLKYEQIRELGGLEFFGVYPSVKVYEYENVAFNKYRYSLTTCNLSVEYLGEEQLPSGALPPTDVKPLPPRHFVGATDLFYTFGIPVENGVIEHNGIRYYYNTGGTLYKIEWSYRGLAMSFSSFRGRSPLSFPGSLLQNTALTEQVLNTFNRNYIDPMLAFTR